VSAQSSGQREWALLCSAIGSALKPEPEALSASLSGDGIDWERLYALARRHGVVVLLYRALSRWDSVRVPTPWLEKFSREALAHGKRNLLTAQEVGRLLARLESNGIPALTFKGPALAAAAYGDLSLRQYGDLDILIRPADVGRATELLLANRYFTDGSIFATERPFGRQDGWVMVDLHWGVTVPLFASLLDETGMWQRAQTVTLAGQPVRTLALEDHLLAVAIHGFKDGWSRLKWVCDVAGLVSRHSTMDWDGLLQRAKTRGALRILWVALALAQHLLDLELPGQIQAQPDADAAVAGLARKLAATMQQEEQLSVLAQSLKECSIQYRTLTGIRRRTAYVGHRIGLLLTPSAEDRTHLPLPDSVQALHYLTRPFRLAWSYGLPWLRS